MSNESVPAAGLHLDLGLVAGLDPARCDARIREALRARDAAKHVAAFHLADLIRSGKHRDVGASSLRDYARRLRVPHSTLHDLYQVGLSLLEQPSLLNAAASGTLGWAQIKLIARVAEPETVEAWIAWAAPRDLDALKERATAQNRGRLPTDPPRRALARTHVSVSARLGPKLWLRFQHGRELREAALGQPVSDREYAEHLLAGALVEVPDPPRPDLDPANAGPVVPEAERAPPTPPEVKEAVLARDGRRCRSCGSTERLKAHHKHFRSRGGPTAPDNLFAACDPCHEALHDGLLYAEGDVEGELRFYDRRGERVDAPRPAAPLRFERSEATGERVAFADLPSELGPDAWERYKELLRWNERSKEVTFTPGVVPKATAGAESPGPEPERDAPRLGDLHGHRAVRSRIGRAIRAARRRGEPLRHLLLTGPAGVGKTRLAEAIAAEVGPPPIQVMAPFLRTPEAMVRTLANLPNGAVLFLDELHGLPDPCVEVLYQALDRGELTLPVRCGLEQRRVRLVLPPFTLVGATTEEDELLDPFRSRLQEHRLQPLAASELAAVVAEAADGRGLTLSADAAAYLGGASRGLPRQALLLLEEVADAASEAETGQVDVGLARDTLDGLGVAHDGLTRLDQAYLQALADAGGQPVGLATLGALLTARPGVLQDLVEPFLLRRGLIEVTTRGRGLLSAGLERLAQRSGHEAGLAA